MQTGTIQQLSETKLLISISLKCAKTTERHTSKRTKSTFGDRQNLDRQDHASIASRGNHADYVRTVGVASAYSQSVFAYDTCVYVIIVCMLQYRK